MNRFLLRAAPFAAVLAFAACNSGGTSSPVSPQMNGVGTNTQSNAQSTSGAYHLPAGYVRACNGSRQGYAQCEAILQTGAQPNVPNGYGPADIQSAYNLPVTTNGAGQTIAIVDAYDDPNAASDLAVYRSTFGLPPANFIKYNQEGQQSNYPQPNSGWAGEESLDLDMVSASCPLCNIILVEGNSNSFSDLGASVNEAVKLGANVVSNSYSGSGVNVGDYRHKGVTLLASAGDDGYGIGDPADLDTVVSVGGTTLMRGGGSRGWTEAAWNGTGSGCSSVKKPKWQTDTGCSHRTSNDVSAIAFGVAIYDSFSGGGFTVAGGTSVTSPLLAGVFGLAGNANKQAGGRTFWRKAHQSHLWDITTGSNGNCSPSYLCKAGVGYDGPTGWGTPNGIGAF